MADDIIALQHVPLVDKGLDHRVITHRCRPFPTGPVEENGRTR